MQIISGVENKILNYFVFTDKYATLCKLGCGHFVCTYFQSLELLIAVNKNCRNIMTKPFFFLQRAPVDDSFISHNFIYQFI